MIEKDLMGEPQISNEHVENNRAVRKMLIERGVKPEALPPAEDIKKVQRNVNCKGMKKGSFNPSKRLKIKTASKSNCHNLKRTSNIKMDAKGKDIRWKQRFRNFEKAFLLLQRTIDIKNPSEAERGGLIQFYERSFELAWKLMRDYLEEQGFSINSPREAIKHAFQSGIIEDGQGWIDALEGRNLTTHTYYESINNPDLLCHIDRVGVVIYKKKQAAGFGFS